MILPVEGTFGEITITFLPQEKEGKYQLSGQFVVTHSILSKFGEAVIITAQIILQRHAKLKGGSDCLQVFEIDGQPLYFIDELTHVTCFLRCEY